MRATDCDHDDDWSRYFATVPTTVIRPCPPIGARP